MKTAEEILKLEGRELDYAIADAIRGKPGEGWIHADVPVYHSEDSPRSLIHEVEQKVIEKVGMSIYTTCLMCACGEEGLAAANIHVATATQRARACLLALKSLEDVGESN